MSYLGAEQGCPGGCSVWVSAPREQQLREIILLLQELKTKLSTLSHTQHPLFAADKDQALERSPGAGAAVSISRFHCGVLCSGPGRCCAALCAAAGAQLWGGHGLWGGWGALWCHITSPLFLVLPLLLHGPICLSLVFYFQFLVAVSQSWPSTRWAAAADVFLSLWCGGVLGGGRGGQVLVEQLQPKGHRTVGCRAGFGAPLAAELCGTELGAAAPHRPEP